MGSYSFRCVVDREPTRLFEVKVKPGYSIGELKDLIREEHYLKEVSVTQISLWKVNSKIHPTLDTVEETKHFVDQILHLDLDSDNPHSTVQLKYPTKSVLSYWENNPSPECLHLIVRLECPPSLTSKRPKRPSVPEDEGRERKRTRKSQWNSESEIPDESDHITKNLLELHRLFWGVPESPLFNANHIKIPDARSLKNKDLKTFETINLPDPVRFPDGSSTIIVTEIFKAFREQMRHDDNAWRQVQGGKWDVPFADPSHSSVVSGQPGIGKTVFLDDLLVHRLQAEMVTIFCNTSAYAYVFSGSGVRRVFLLDGDRIPELDTNPLSCALVNLGVDLLQPPVQFNPSNRLGRLVVASSVHVTCFKEHPALTYYMPTWDWDDLYCGSLVHVGKVTSDTTRPITVEAGHNERLREAYWKFAGIPRLCYKTFMPKAMEDHLRRIDSAIDNIRSIKDFSRDMKGLLQFNKEACHNLIRIEPVPDTDWMESRSELKSSFITELVFRQVCLHQRIISDDISHLLLIPDFRGHAGRLFEAAAHRTLEKGMRIDPTPITPKAPHLVFNILKANPNVNRRFYTLSVRAAPHSHTAHAKYFGQYLLPISKTQGSFDALVIYQYFTVFLKMTVSTKHCIKLNGILDLLKELPANAKKKLYIVFVVPSDDKETQSFGPQNIISPQDARAEDIALVSSIPQYVYRLPLKAFNELCIKASLDI